MTNQSHLSFPDFEEYMSAMLSVPTQGSKG
jgi:hypothetical protein